MDGSRKMMPLLSLGQLALAAGESNDEGGKPAEHRDDDAEHQENADVHRHGQRRVGLPEAHGTRERRARSRDDGQRD
jgi:hypothetical protein